MKLKIILFAATICCAMGATAQIRVINNGYVGFGRYPSHKFHVNLAGEKARFEFSSWQNIYFDNSGLCESPCIYPGYDWYLQLGKRENRVGTIFVQTIHVNKTYTDSDSTFKCDFKKLNREQDKFRRIKPYKYHFTKDFISKLPEKERAKFNHEHYGFKAQNIEKIYPELTYRDDSTGKYSIDYTGFIPILVEMVQELQDLTTAQSNKIKELQKQVDDLAKADDNNGNSGKNPRKTQKKSVKPLDVEAENADVEVYETSETIDVAINAFLFQNTPNPFSHETEIKYYIPENAENAVLYVFSLQGNMLLTKQLSQFGNSSVVLLAGELQPGMYIYTLAVDGQEADSKRMIITEE